MNRQFKHKITGNLATETSTGKNYRITMPQNFTIPKWLIENSCDWEEIINIPQYVKCIAVNLCTQFTHGKIYKTIEYKEGIKNSIYVEKDNDGEINGMHLTAFVSSTKEEYDLQNRTPLFYTEDNNVPVYEGDKYWYVDEEFELFHNEKAIHTSGSCGFKYFSTSVGAQEFIDNNKPMYSKQDVLNMFNDIGNSKEVADVHIKYLKHK